MSPLPDGRGFEVKAICYDLARCVKAEKVIQNCCGLVNEIHGCRYRFASGNPCSIECDEDGSNILLYCGLVVARWRYGDLGSCLLAANDAHRLYELLWDASRMGYVSLSPGQFQGFVVTGIHEFRELDI